MDHRDRRNYFLTAALLIVLGGLFLLRGPIRAIQGGSDLAHLYAAAALFVEGEDPYDGLACARRMREEGYERPQHVAEGSLYPPPTLAVLSPLGVMSWRAASLLWLAINLLSCGVLVWAAAQWLTIHDRRMRWMVAALVVVAQGAVATSMSLGQLSLVAAACICAGLVLMQRHRGVNAGLLIGLACLIKPQLGLGFLLLILFMRQWRAAAAGVILIGAVSLAGVAQLISTTPDWAQHFKNNLATGQATGGIMDAGVGGPLRHQMIDLRPLINIALPPSSVGSAALGLVGLLALVAIVRLLQLGLREHLLLAASGVGLLILMPVYHRYYDAVLLLPLLVLVVNGLKNNPRDTPLLIVAMAMLPIFLPGPALLVRLTQKGVIPERLADAALWQHGVLQHQSWCLLIAAIALVWWTYRLPLPGQSAKPVGESAA